MRDADRLAVVRQCVEQLWETRRDGRWGALENALVDVLEPKKPGAKHDGAALVASSAARPPETRSSNVIVLVENLDRIRRRRERLRVAR